MHILLQTTSTYFNKNVFILILLPFSYTFNKYHHILNVFLQGAISNG